MEQTDTDREVYTPRDVARRYRTDAATVTRWAKEGLVPVAFRTPGGHRRFWKDEIDALIAGTAQPLAKPADQ